MKSIKTIQTFFKTANVLSQIAFIFSVIGFCGCAAGILSLGLGNGGLIKIGGITLHGLISNDLGYNTKSITAMLSGWAVVCAGEAVLSKFAEICFKNELSAGTPFTFSGAKELMRLGILALAVPTGCAVLGGIVEGVIAGFMNVEKIAAADMYIDNSANLALGIMFIVISLLCRYGAELNSNNETDVC